MGNFLRTNLGPSPGMKKVLHIINFTSDIGSLSKIFLFCFSRPVLSQFVNQDKVKMYVRVVICHSITPEVFYYPHLVMSINSIIHQQNHEKTGIVIENSSSALSKTRNRCPSIYIT